MQSSKSHKKQNALERAISQSTLSHFNKVGMQNTQMERSVMLLSLRDAKMAGEGHTCRKTGRNSVNDLAQKFMRNPNCLDRIDQNRSLQNNHAHTWIQLGHMFNANDSDSGNLHYDFWIDPNYLDSLKMEEKYTVQLQILIIYGPE